MKMNKRFIFLALFSVLSLQTVCYGMFVGDPRVDKRRAQWAKHSKVVNENLNGNIDATSKQEVLIKKAKHIEEILKFLNSQHEKFIKASDVPQALVTFNIIKRSVSELNRNMKRLREIDFVGAEYSRLKQNTKNILSIMDELLY